MLYAIVGMLVIIADQYIKFWIQGHVWLNQAGPEIIPGILSLTNVHNDGAAFGFLAGTGARIPFIILAGVFTLAVIIALATRLISGKLARWSIVLVTAGALSNCLDRVIYGYVQDMFKFDFINFPVFNLADVFITVFAVLFALAVIFGKTRKPDEDDYEEFEEEEEEVPKVSKRKAKRAARRKAKDADEFDEEDEEEEEPVPVRKPKKQKPEKPARKQRAAAVKEPEEEEEPAPEAAPKPQPAKKAASKKAVASKRAAEAEGEDPFADWDRPPARKDKEERVQAAKAKAAATRAEKPESPAAEKPVQRPAEAPAAKPAAKPAAAEEEFSLDDILNEFR